MIPSLDQRPIIVCVAGPNGAGKSTFYEAFLRPAALRFVNADVLARELQLEAYAAAALADRIRHELVARRESFIFETVFSDPVGEKVAFLRQAADQGYAVVLCFIGLDSPARSDERVAMRVTQGGHDIPTEKLRDRYPRTLANLARAIRQLPVVDVYDNTNLVNPFRLIAEFENGHQTKHFKPLPRWFRNVNKE